MRIDKDGNDEELQSLSYQFEWMHTRNTAANIDENGFYPQQITNKYSTKTTDLKCHGMSKVKGKLLQHGKLYYHYNHFSCNQF